MDLDWGGKLLFIKELIFMSVCNLVQLQIKIWIE